MYTKSVYERKFGTELHGCQGLIKENSTSTKLHIFYNASCKTSSVSGKSLNKTLMLDRQLQTDIYVLYNSEDIGFFLGIYSANIFTNFGEVFTPEL